jgi:hypothetical protein
MADEEKKFEIKLNGGYSSISAAVFVLFLVFWWQSGWYRIDCAIGVQRACDLIAAEKEYQPKAEKP